MRATARSSSRFTTPPAARCLTGKGRDTTVTLEHPHLWDGVRDPYLYTCVVVRLVLNGEVQDEVRQRFGVRSFG